jgi:hypothetical protein
MTPHIVRLLPLQWWLNAASLAASNRLGYVDSLFIRHGASTLSHHSVSCQSAICTHIITDHDQVQWLLLKLYSVIIPGIQAVM